MVPFDKEELGVVLMMKINVISDQKNRRGSVDYSFGSNKLPTKTEADAAIGEALTQFNKTLKCKDARLVGFRDFGFAEPRDFAWCFDDECSAAGDD